MYTNEAMRVLFPMEVLQEKTELLYKYYKEQYKNKFSSLIKDRMNNIVYLFDSSPVVTYNFLLSNTNIAVNEEYLSLLKEENDDYKSLNQKLSKQIIDSTILLFCIYHNISSIKGYDVEEILNLIVLMCNDRKSYIERASDLGIRPIEDEKKREQFLTLNKQLLCSKDAKLVIESKWGQNIRKRLSNEGLFFDDVTFASLLSYTENGFCRAFEVKNGKINPQVIITIPILKRYCEGMNVDLIFLHEFRHAIEISGVDRIGLYDKSGIFNCFNEVRTEGCAINDDKNIDAIFSKRTLKIWRDFHGMLYYHNSAFFNKYNDILNDLAIENDIENMYKIFGKKDILEYDNILNSIYNEMEAKYQDWYEVVIKDDNNLCKKKIKILEENVNKAQLEYK